MLHKCATAEETALLAEDMAKSAQPGDIIALTGPLGAGKTVFAQGFARGLGYLEPVTSPTFTIMNIYEGGRLPLYHFDLYRLPDDMDGANGLAGIGYEDYFYADGVCVVEWAERAEALLPETAIRVKLTPTGASDDEYRLVEIITKELLR